MSRQMQLKGWVGNEKEGVGRGHQLRKVLWVKLMKMFFIWGALGTHEMVALWCDQICTSQFSDHLLICFLLVYLH